MSDEKTPAEKARELREQPLGMSPLDLEQLLQVRDAVEKALSDLGLLVNGAGIGCDQADVSAELDDHRQVLVTMEIIYDEDLQ